MASQRLALALGGQLGIRQARWIDDDQEQIADQPATARGRRAAGRSRVSTARPASVKRGRRVFVGNGRHDVEQQVAADQPEHRGDVVGGDLLPANAMT